MVDACDKRFLLDQSTKTMMQLTGAEGGGLVHRIRNMDYSSKTYIGKTLFSSFFIYQTLFVVTLWTFPNNCTAHIVALILPDTLH